MDLQNVKIDWNRILSGQIENLESMFSAGNQEREYIRKGYAPIIDMLNENKTPSRVIINKGTVCAYAFYVLSSKDRNTLYATVGFLHDEEENATRSGPLLKWLSGEAEKNSMRLLLNGIFNEPGNFKEEALKNGFSVLERIRMELDMERHVPGKPPAIDGKLQPRNIGRSDIKRLSNLIYDVFSNGDERIMLPESREGMPEFIEPIENGQFGSIIKEASFSLSENGEEVGAAIFTDGSSEPQNIPLLLFFLIRSEYRGKGYSRAMLSMGLERLWAMGRKKAQLWVNINNDAKKLYTQMGLVETGDRSSIYYLQPGRQGN